MKQDVMAYMKCYNLERLHSANDDLSPVEFEDSQLTSVQFGLTSTTSAVLVSPHYRATNNDLFRISKVD